MPWPLPCHRKSNRIEDERKKNVIERNGDVMYTFRSQEKKRRSKKKTFIFSRTTHAELLRVCWRQCVPFRFVFIRSSSVACPQNCTLAAMAIWPKYILYYYIAIIATIFIYDLVISIFVITTAAAAIVAIVVVVVVVVAVPTCECNRKRHIPSFSISRIWIDIDRRTSEEEKREQMTNAYTHTGTYPSSLLSSSSSSTTTTISQRTEERKMIMMSLLSCRIRFIGRVKAACGTFWFRNTSSVTKKKREYCIGLSLSQSSKDEEKDEEEEEKGWPLSARHHRLSVHAENSVDLILDLLVAISATHTLNTIFHLSLCRAYKIEIVQAFLTRVFTLVYNCISTVYRTCPPVQFIVSTVARTQCRRYMNNWEMWKMKRRKQFLFRATDCLFLLFSEFCLTRDSS